MANIQTPIPTGTRLLVVSNGSTEVSQGMILVDANGAPLPSSQNAGQRVGVGTWVDANNSTTTSLLAGQSFTGTATDLLASGVAAITYNLYADPDQMVTSPVLTFQFSPDGTNWDVQVPATIGNGHIFIPVPLRPVERFFRISYLNGSSNQTAFRLSTYLHSAAVEPLARTGIQALPPPDAVTVTRALVEPGFKGRLAILGADRGIGGEAIVASYVVQDKVQFDVPYANNNLGITTSGGATAVQAPTTGSTITTANAAGASSANVAGLKKIRYSPGRETRMEVTLAFPAAGLANSDCVAGLSDTPTAPTTGNGVIVGYVGTTFGLHIVSGGSVTTIPRASWNGDPFDGSGLSEFRDSNIPQALDLTKANAYRLRFVWYGVGPVYLEIKSPDDKWVIAHVLTYPNSATVPYIQSPNVYIVWDASKQAGAGTGTLSLRSFSASAGTVEAEINFERFEVHGNKLVQVATNNQTANVAPVYTVSAGRQLLVSSLTSTIIAVAQSAGMRLEVRDGGTGGALKWTNTAPRANNTSNAVSTAFSVPLQFLTDVTLVLASGGTANYDLSLTGYEKEV